MHFGIIPESIFQEVSSPNCGLESYTEYERIVISALESREDIDYLELLNFNLECIKEQGGNNGLKKQLIDLHILEELIGEPVVLQENQSIILPLLAAFVFSATLCRLAIALAKKARRAPNPAAGAQGRILVRILDRHAFGTEGLDGSAKFTRQVVAVDHHLLNTGVFQPLEQIGDDGPPLHRHGGLRSQR